MSPGKGRGPPKDKGGRGPPEDGGPPSEVPPGREKHPIDELREKFEDIVEESNGEGRLGVKVFDENGNEKQRVEYLRVNGEGSIEAWKYDDSDGRTLNAQNASNSGWAVRRRDKLNQNRKDKL